MKRQETFRLAAIVSLSLTSLAHADQILYDETTDKPTAYLNSDDNGLYDIPDGDLFGYLEDSILYDRKGLHSIGRLCGECLYENGGILLGYFTKQQATECE